MSVTLDEVRLWQSVVLRAVNDAIWIDAEEGGPPQEKIRFHGASITRRLARRLRDEAIFWLTLDNKDFHEVCHRAELDPHLVRKGAQRVVEASNEQKAAWAASGISVSDLR